MSSVRCNSGGRSVDTSCDIPCFSADDGGLRISRIVNFVCPIKIVETQFGFLGRNITRYTLGLSEVWLNSRPGVCLECGLEMQDEAAALTSTLHRRVAKVSIAHHYFYVAVFCV